MTKEGVHVKDLRVFGNRNLEEITIVDNACYSYGYHLQNGIPIIPFYDNKKDEELKNIIPYIKQFIDDDIRTINKNTFKLHLLKHCNDIQDGGELLFFKTT